MASSLGVFHIFLLLLARSQLGQHHSIRACWAGGFKVQDHHQHMVYLHHFSFADLDKGCLKGPWVLEYSTLSLGQLSLHCIVVAAVSPWR